MIGIFAGHRIAE